MVETGGAFFEKRNDENDALLFGELLKSVGGGAGDRFGKFEMVVVFGLAEILGAEEFLGADDLRALRNGFLGGDESFFEIGLRVGRAGGLDEANFYRRVHLKKQRELAGTFCVRLGAAGFKDVAFPFTPTLSLGERESTHPFCAHMHLSINQAPRSRTELANDSPSPQGRGLG